MLALAAPEALQEAGAELAPEAQGEALPVAADSAVAEGLRAKAARSAVGRPPEDSVVEQEDEQEDSVARVRQALVQQAVVASRLHWTTDSLDG